MGRHTSPHDQGDAPPLLTATLLTRSLQHADCNTLHTLPHTATYEYLSAEWKWRERGSALQSKRQQQQQHMSSLPALSSEISISSLKTPFSSTKTSGVPQTATCVWSKETIESKQAHAAAEESSRREQQKRLLAAAKETIESKQAHVLSFTAELGNQKKFPE